MSYNYFASLRKLSGSNIQDEWTRDFQALMDDQFNNAYDVYTVEEETFFDSKIYQDVVVRINHIINTETGEKIGDDYKNILFKEYNHSIYLGRYYKFDNNYWLTINVDKIKSLTSTASVRRCNNLLRWLDENGGYHEIPCVLDNKILENRNYSTAGSSLVLPSGVLECITQLNNETNIIRPNQRFLFGNADNWTAYKVQGGGVNNYNNIQTTDNDTGGLLKLTLVVDFVNPETDNVSLGIAEYYQYNFVVNINEGDITGQATNTFNLTANVTLNGQVVSQSVAWSSANTSIATINSSGLLTLISTGTTTIRCTLSGNDDYYDEITVICGATPPDEIVIRISPTNNYIYLGENETFQVQLYLNNVLQADTFTFTVIPNTVPSTNYTYTALTGNTFKIQNNEAFLFDKLTVRCSSDSRVAMKDFDFYLRGGW